MRNVTKQEARKLIGKQIYAVRKDGSVATGKLVRIQGSQLILQPSGKGKKVSTKAIIPLVLFDLLAIGTAPYVYGGYNAPYGAYPYGGYNYYGNPYGYW